MGLGLGLGLGLGMGLELAQLQLAQQLRSRRRRRITRRAAASAAAAAVAAVGGLLRGGGGAEQRLRVTPDGLHVIDVGGGGGPSRGVRRVEGPVLLHTVTAWVTYGCSLDHMGLQG